MVDQVIRNMQRAFYRLYQTRPCIGLKISWVFCSCRFIHVCPKKLNDDLLKYPFFHDHFREFKNLPNAIMPNEEISSFKHVKCPFPHFSHHCHQSDLVCPFCIFIFPPPLLLKLVYLTKLCIFHVTHTANSVWHLQNR